MTDTEASTISEKDRGNCLTQLWKAIQHERRVGRFEDEDYNGKTLDIDASFALNHNDPIRLILKIIIFILATTTFIHSIVVTPHPYFHFAYFSYWGLAWAEVYLALSLMTTAFPSCSSRRWLVNQTWIWFSVASVHLILIVIAFWGFEHDLQAYDFRTLMEHGGICTLVLLDGFLLNRIPVRLKHVFLTWILAAIWLVWSIFQDTLVGGNPYTPDPDDAMYEMLQWEAYPLLSILYVLGNMFGIVPGLQLTIWLVSLCCRCYKESDIEEEVVDEDVEKGDSDSATFEEEQSGAAIESGE